MLCKLENLSSVGRPLLKLEKKHYRLVNPIAVCMLKMVGEFQIRDILELIVNHTIIHD
jgi:hypothetical protein